MGSIAGRSHTGDREFPRFCALELASSVSQEDGETIQRVLTRRSPCNQKEQPGYRKLTLEEWLVPEQLMIKLSGDSSREEPHDASANSIPH